MKAIAFCIAILFSSAAIAGRSDTVRINNKIITTQMTTQEVVNKIGRPVRVVQLQVGEAWEYKRGNKIVTLIVMGETVTAIDEQ